jgi:membrane fusion protein (multidrug efflux system)
MKPAITLRRGQRRFLLLVVVPLVAALVGGFVYLQGGRYVETENAYVKADKVPVSAEVAGTVKEVLVQENETVAAGQPLFRLDATPYRVAVSKAEAKVAQVRSDVAVTRASYREKQAEIAVARTRHAFALRDQQRQAELVAKNFVSASRFDDAKQGAELAAQQTVALERDLARVAESLGGGPSAPVERHPAFLAAMAELHEAELDLARVEVRAATAGTVSKPPKVGQYLAPGGTAMALVVNGNVWLEANFPETDLTYVHPGQPVTIEVDTYPGKTWLGEVESLSPATGSEFSVIPAQNATGNWVKIAQRVPVRIRLHPADGLPPLRAGLSTMVRVDTGHRRRLFGASF